MFQDIKVSEDLNAQFRSQTKRHDTINIKILNAGAWAARTERVSVSLPLELEDFIPDIEEFYKKKHSGRKLQWYHHMSNGTITFANNIGRFDLDGKNLNYIFIIICDTFFHKIFQLQHFRWQFFLRGINVPMIKYRMKICAWLPN